jgi:hypothetical protein
MDTVVTEVLRVLKEVRGSAPASRRGRRTITARIGGTTAGQQR